MCLKDSSVLFIMNIMGSSTIKFLKVYLFISLAVSGLKTQHTGSFIAAQRLSSCGAWVPEPQASVTAVCGLSCSVACGISAPQ